MIAVTSKSGLASTSRQAEEHFEALLPKIEGIANYAFRRLPPWRKEELIADVIAKSFEAFARLAERGREDLAYATPLAHFAIKQICDGRQVGCRRNIHDVLSSHAQRQKNFSVRSLDGDPTRGYWEELAVADRKTSPADVASFRIDFRDWLHRLRRFNRQVALRLAAGDTTSEAARHFNRSRARISQLRQELRANWEVFQALPEAV